MSSYDSLLEGISEELGIVQGDHESSSDWKARVVYSIIGCLAEASLYDVQEDGSPVSVQHLKNRVEELYTIYSSLYPEIYEISPEKLSEEIYSILLKGGCIYHSPNRITPSANSEALHGRVVFVRGVPLKHRLHRSGLGAYMPSGNTDSRLTLAEMFGLPVNTLAEYWKHLISSCEWHKDSVLLAMTEYLRTTPPFKYGYFTAQPYTDGRVSLMRTGIRGSWSWYMYRYENGNILMAQIPSWQTDNCEYRRIANVCLYSRGVLPTSEYHADGDIVSLSLGYLYPPSELNMLRLYSWPERYDFRPFKHILSSPVFFALKAEFERIGYTFLEV